MRKCKFRTKLYGNFHQWVTFDKLYGVVEDNNGFIELVNYDDIQFIDRRGFERGDSEKVDDNILPECENAWPIIMVDQCEDPVEELRRSINVGSTIVKDIWNDINKAFDLESGR